jgi:hypothetical protein
LIERESLTWRALAKHIDTEIESARKRIEEPGRDPITTEFERGQIKALRKILALADPLPPILTAPSVDY